MSDDNGDRVFSVRSWQLIVLLAVQLLGLGVAYGRISERIDETAHDIERIEDNRVVTQDDFNAWKAELLNRMDRIERKIDGIK